MTSHSRWLQQFACRLGFRRASTIRSRPAGDLQCRPRLTEIEDRAAPGDVLSLCLGAAALDYTGYVDTAPIPGSDSSAVATITVGADEPTGAGLDARTQPPVELRGGLDDGGKTDRVSLGVPADLGDWSGMRRWDDLGDALLSAGGVGQPLTSIPAAEARPGPAPAGAASGGVVITGGSPGSSPDRSGDAVLAPATDEQPALLAGPSPAPATGPTHPAVAVAHPAPAAPAATGGQRAEDLANGRSYSVHHDSTLSVAAESGILSAYDYDLTGVPADVSLDTDPSHGQATVSPDGSFTYTPNQGYIGSDSFTYVIDDGTSPAPTGTVQLAVVNDAPLGFDQELEVVHDQVLDDAAPGVLTDASDSEGDPITAVEVSGPSNGTLALDANGHFTYTPDEHFVGTDTFTYKINDSHVDSPVYTVTIDVTDFKPIAVDDAYSVVHDHTLTVDNQSPPYGVLSNDLDQDSDQLTARVDTGPSNGTLDLHPDGTFTYTPNTHFVGTDSFTYVANDGPTDSDPGTVVISVTNHNPLAITTTKEFFAGSTLNWSVGKQDADGDPLTVSLVSGPSGGSLALNPDGSFAYTPNNPAPIYDTFTYTVSDGVEVSNVGTMYLYQIMPITPNGVAWGAGYTGIHDRPLNGTAPWAAGPFAIGDDQPPPQWTVVVVSPPTHGTLAMQPSGSFVYTPNPGWTGTDQFTYYATDGTHATNTAPVILTIVNTRPVARADAYSVAQYDTLTVPAPGVQGNDDDADGDVLTASLVSGVSHGTLTFNADGSFVYTPAVDWFGHDQFVYKLWDGAAFSLTAVVPVFTIPIDYTGRISIYNGLDGATGGQLIRRRHDKRRGAVTVANRNNTNGDFNGDFTDIIDRDQTNVTANGTKGRDEVDLMRLNLPRPTFWIGNVPFPVNRGLVRVRVASGNGIQFWTTRTKNAGTQAPATLDVATAFAGGDVEWWVEATAASANLRDINLVYEYLAPGAANWRALYNVRATAVWVTQTGVWKDRVANPAAGAGALADLTDAGLQGLINNTRIAADGTRYGMGPHSKNLAGADTRTGGRIVLEFTVTPANVETLGVRFDITRQGRMNAYKIDNDGKGKLDAIAAFTRQFPWLAPAGGQDNELPNDDKSDGDEQNTPTNRHIYVWDAPGATLNADGPGWAYAILRFWFKEWVRMRLDRAPFRNQRAHPNFAANLAADATEAVEGSRVSDRIDWHYVNYLVRDANGKFVNDTAAAAVSASAPLLNSPGGATGTAAVTVLGGDTEGWTLTYADDGTNSKWSIAGQVNGAAVAADAKDSQNRPTQPAQGTTWTVTVPGKVTVTITQGATKFAAGDTFQFATFKTVAPGGRLNEIDLGQYTDVKGDANDRP
jgi:hypothetical protein